MDLTQIKIKSIPALFPFAGYEDRIFFNCREVISSSAEIEIIKTEKRFKTIDNINSSNKLFVQSLFYDVFELDFEFKESIRVNTLRVGEELILITSEDIPITVEFLELNGNFIDDTTNYSYKLLVRTIKDDTKAISNYLESRLIGSKFSLNSNHLLYDFTTYGVYFYTKIQPIFRVSENFNEKKAILNNGIDIVLNGSYYSICEIRFYLIENDLISFEESNKKALKYNNNVASGIILKLPSLGRTLIAVKVPEYKISDSGLTNLFQVDVTFFYDKTDFSL